MQASLRIGDTGFPLASLGPDFCVLREPQDIPEGAFGILSLTVDRRTYEWDVQLPEGAVPFESRVALSERKRIRSDRDSTGTLSLKLPKIDPPEGCLF